MDTVSIVLFAGAFIFLAVYYYRQWSAYKEEQDKLTWPRMVLPCPDFWVHEGNGVCRNVHNIGKCPNDPQTGRLDPNQTVAFNGALYDGANGKENKCKWTKRCGATWEGIDNLCA